MQNPIFDDIAEFLSMVATWPWVWIILSVLTLVMAVAVIAFTTQHSIRSQTLAINRIMADTGGTETTSLVTVGRGAVKWLQGGFTMVMVKRFPEVSEDELEDLADKAVASFSLGLAGLGIDPRDVIEMDPILVESGPATLAVSVLLRDPAQEKDVTRAALASGFKEETSGTRAEITAENAHDTAGKRAVADALDNSKTLTAGLSLAKHTLDIVGAELETVFAPGEGPSVVKSATLRWRYVPARA